MSTESGTHAARAPPPQKVFHNFRKKCCGLVSKLSLRGKRQASAYEMLQQECNNELRSTEDVERFFYAAARGDTKYMKQVIDSHGLLTLLGTGPGHLNVNVQSSNNTTALMCAARCGRLDAVRYLLSKKADPNIANNSGRTALHNATVTNIFYSHERIVNPLIMTLLDAGADATALDANDTTPLERAVISDNCSAQYTLGAKTDADAIAVLRDIQAKRENRALEIQALAEADDDEKSEEDWSSDEDEDTDVGSTESYSTYSDFEPCEYAASSLGTFSGPALRASAIGSGPSPSLAA